MRLLRAGLPLECGKRAPRQHCKHAITQCRRELNPSLLQLQQQASVPVISVDDLDSLREHARSARAMRCSRRSCCSSSSIRSIRRGLRRRRRDSILARPNVWLNVLEVWLRVTVIRLAMQSSTSCGHTESVTPGPGDASPTFQRVLNTCGRSWNSVVRVAQRE